jgi:uncharacterized protein (DUF2267 family)
MPIPSQYQRATDHFYEFLIDVRDTAGLETTHAAYTMVQGVFQTFRRRIGLGDAIRFAGVLPSVLRSIFVADWDTNEPRRPFEARAAMTREAQSLRSDHNYAPDTCIRDVAEALRRHIDEDAFDQVLGTLPEEAAEFWRP